MVDFKSRHLSYYEYLQKLQLEYIVAELRKKIYPSLKDKKYYLKLMESKKNTIEDICERNSLQNIFSDKKIKKEKYSKIYNIISYPNFLYRDKEEQLKFEQKDKAYYYMKDTDFKVSINSEDRVGKLVSISFIAYSATILFDDNSEGVYGLDILTRIL